MSVFLPNPDSEVIKIVEFLQLTFTRQHKLKAVIAVSGGIDSALVLSLASQALSPQQIFPIILPYHDQSTTDNHQIVDFNQIPIENITEYNIGEAVDQLVELFGASGDQIRTGNIMARVRMIAIYDLAKKMDALVVGTENKSEKYLAYYTRFGDEASDIEPIQHLYKTQVRQLAAHLNLPASILTKAPSAGLWTDQTDENEFGFSYDQADQVLEQYIDEKKSPELITIANGGEEVVKRVVAFVAKNSFKHQVPYIL